MLMYRTKKSFYASSDEDFWGWWGNTEQAYELVIFYLTKIIFAVVER